MTYSPLLSIATGAFEVALAIWVLRGDNARTTRRLMALLLVLLAGYQWAEALICGAHGPAFMSRLAFADITWLPPVGLLLLVHLAQPKRGWVRAAAWSYAGLGGLWTVIVLTMPRFLTATVCETVFASYRTGLPLLYQLYGLYYDLGLMGLLFGGTWAAVYTRDETRRALIADFLTGNLSFVLAALVTMLALVETRGASPSILCHFALLLAVSIGHMGLRLNRHAEADSHPPLQTRNGW